MGISARAAQLVAEITQPNVKLSDLRVHGKAIKKDHDLAMELWSTGQHHPRLLATLLFDKKLLTEEVLDRLASDLLQLESKERCHIADWLLVSRSVLIPQ